jgi:hypothetical protein
VYEEFAAGAGEIVPAGGCADHVGRICRAAACAAAGAADADSQADRTPGLIVVLIFIIQNPRAVNISFHLEVLVDRMRREFKVEANIGRPQVAYRETIRKKVEKVEWALTSGCRWPWRCCSLLSGPRTPGGPGSLAAPPHRPIPITVLEFCTLAQRRLGQAGAGLSPPSGPRQRPDRAGDRRAERAAARPAARRPRRGLAG